MMDAKDVQEYREKLKTVKTIGEFKELGRELRDKFSLTDRQALDILNGGTDEVLEVLASHK